MFHTFYETSTRYFLRLKIPMNRTVVQTLIAKSPVKKITPQRTSDDLQYNIQS